MRRFASDVRAAAERFRLDQGFLLASALSFAFLLCLAPLALILFSVAGFLLESEEIAEYIVQYATLLVPAYGDEVMELLDDDLHLRRRAGRGRSRADRGVAAAFPRPRADRCVGTIIAVSRRPPDDRLAEFKKEVVWRLER